MINKGCVTIIIPAYNAESTIDECLKSVVKQSYSNLEILLIDDGSQDDTLKKSIEWVNKDERIRLIRIENGGVSHARNLGIREAKGTFLSFVDSDDIIAEGFIESLVSMLDLKKVQCTCVGIEPFKNEKDIYKCIEHHKIHHLYNNLEMTLLGAVGGFMANKLYVTDIIRKNNLFLNEKLSISEDLVFNFRYFSYCTGVAYDEGLLYFYRQDVSSAFNNLRNSKWFTVIDAYKELLEMNMTKDVHNQLCFLYHMLLCEAKYRCNYFNDNVQKQYILEELEKIKKLYRPNTLTQWFKIILFMVAPRLVMLYRRRKL